ncbi:MAG: Holliday junction branch migration protein RuvA [Blautia sp.]|nr:Holliday junction branch migration protein RuvA [Blautia sp.]
MIAFIQGRVDSLTENSAILDTGFMGFEVFMTRRDLDRLSTGSHIKAYTHFQVREDAMQLFGFLRQEDRQLFRLLIAVSGIGPRGAIGLLGAMSAEELRFAIFSDDAKTISQAPGIGKKTAQKLILELKDKVDLTEGLDQPAQEGGFEGGVAKDMNVFRKEAIEALVALGYSSTEASRAVSQVPEPEAQDVEMVLKAALKHI